MRNLMMMALLALLALAGCSPNVPVGDTCRGHWENSAAAAAEISRVSCSINPGLCGPGEVCDAGICKPASANCSADADCKDPRASHCQLPPSGGIVGTCASVSWPMWQCVAAYPEGANCAFSFGGRTVEVHSVCASGKCTAGKCTATPTPDGGTTGGGACEFSSQTGCQAGLSCLPQPGQADQGQVACQNLPALLRLEGAAANNRVECDQGGGSSTSVLIAEGEAGKWQPACITTATVAVRSVGIAQLVAAYKGPAGKGVISPPTGGNAWVQLK